MEAVEKRRNTKEKTPSLTTNQLLISVFADAPGNDHQNRNGEYALLFNESVSPIDISGWTLCDLAQHCFVFPGGSVVSPGGQVVLFTGSGRTDGISFFWGSPSAIWNNRGDTATLFDRDGRVIVRYVY